VLGALLAGAVSTTLFALAHGDQDPWLFADRFAFGLTASWLVWRTGGLEAGIAMHVVNNLVAFGFGVAYGQLEESLLVTEADPKYVLVDLGVLAVSAVVLDRLAWRRRLSRTVRPGWPAHRGDVRRAPHP
jgi:membrane protease YdiL (CAAX protease family)